MDTVWLSLEGAWDLLRYGLVVGAGLPILFALGVRFIRASRRSAEMRADWKKNAEVLMNVYRSLGE